MGRYEQAMRSPRLLQPLRHRDFRLLWAGQTISLLGDGVFNVALVWQTLEISSTPGALAVVTLARSAPRLALLLVAGAVSDRVSRRWLIVATDALQGIAIAAIAALALSAELELWHLATLAAIVGAANAFYLPTITSITPELVPRDDLPHANALRSGSQMLGQELVGPALGGILVASVGAGLAFAVDAASFAVSVLALVAIRRRTSRRAHTQRLWTDMREGLRYAKERRWLWISLLAAAFGNLFLTGSVSILIPIVIKNDLGGGAGELGAYFAAIGFGGALGILTTGRLRARQPRIPAAFGAWAISTVALAVIGLAPSLVVIVVLTVVIGGALQYGNIMWETLLQEAVPQSILGRVVSFDWFVSLALQPVSFALAAPVAAAVGAPAALAAAGILDLAVLAVGFTRRGVRDSRPEIDARSTPPDE